MPPTTKVKKERSAGPATKPRQVRDRRNDSSPTKLYEDLDDDHPTRLLIDEIIENRLSYRGQKGIPTIPAACYGVSDGGETTMACPITSCKWNFEGGTLLGETRVTQGSCRSTYFKHITTHTRVAVANIPARDKAVCVYARDHKAAVTLDIAARFKLSANAIKLVLKSHTTHLSAVVDESKVAAFVAAAENSSGVKRDKQYIQPISRRVQIPNNAGPTASTSKLAVQQNNRENVDPSSEDWADW
ncbi:hypothetical protein RQP46_008761 [Phenoliferia psychrophenolica]